MRVDLNCDLGEGTGQDEALMPLVTSANIACGGHAGDEATMRAAVELAWRHGVAIGAHPGFVDREHFGRRELLLPAADITDLVRRQVEAIRGITPLTHVKPHGGLYTLAARDRTVAEAIAAAIAAVDTKLVLVGLAGSCLLEAAAAWGLRSASEAFADRTYQPDGSLTPRSQPHALITDVEAAAAQVLQMLREGRVRAVDGRHVPLHVDTICIHGDGTHAVEFAKRLRSELADVGVDVRALGEQR